MDAPNVGDPTHVTIWVTSTFVNVEGAIRLLVVFLEQMHMSSPFGVHCIKQMLQAETTEVN